MNDDKPSIEEKYSSATHTSNLRVQAERGGQVDIIIAMGWNPSRVGAALMRLHSEFDGSEHPRRPAKATIELLASSLPRIQAGERKQGDVMVPNMVLDLDAARRQAHDWHLHELKLLFGKLKTMPDVRFQLALWAGRQMIENPEHRVAEVLAWWLDHVCPGCDGRAKELIPGTPHKSHKDCRVCKGTGETRIPHSTGNDNYVKQSKKMLRYINDCVKAAQTSVKQRLQAYQPKKEGK